MIHMIYMHMHTYMIVFLYNFHLLFCIFHLVFCIFHLLFCIFHLLFLYFSFIIFVIIMNYLSSL